MTTNNESKDYPSAPVDTGLLETWANEMFASDLGQDSPFKAQAESLASEAFTSQIPDPNNLADVWLDESALASIPGLLGQEEKSAAIPSATKVPSIPATLPHAGNCRALRFAPVLVPSSGYDFFDVAAIRRDFPILGEKVNGKDLVWLDNAATTQKPKQVIDRISYFYEHENSNVHRGAHALAARSTDAYENARKKVSSFIKAPSADNIVFTRGTTEAINLIAQAWGREHLGAGDEVIVSHLEHHANIVPWQMICAEKGAVLKVIPVDNSGQILLNEYEGLFTRKTRMVAVTQVSNALGTITPVKEITAIAHRHGATVLIDGAQAISHIPVDVLDIGCDFYVFSGHKVFAPTGIGALYGTAEALSALRPWQGGGNMIADVTFERTVYQAPPYRFEAGTGNIADAVGLGAAIDYVSAVGMESINRYEHLLFEYAESKLVSVNGLSMVGSAKNRTSVLSFTLKGFNNDEVGQALSAEGIAVRTGHHCAQPILRRFGLESSVRPSLAFYNTHSEIDFLISVLRDLTGTRRL